MYLCIEVVCNFVFSCRTRSLQCHVVYLSDTLRHFIVAILSLLNTIIVFLLPANMMGTYV